MRIFYKGNKALLCTWCYHHSACCPCGGGKKKRRIDSHQEKHGSAGVYVGWLLALPPLQVRPPSSSLFVWCGGRARKKSLHHGHHPFFPPLSLSRSLSQTIAFPINQERRLFSLDCPSLASISGFPVFFYPRFPRAVISLDQAHFFPSLVITPRLLRFGLNSFHHVGRRKLSSFISSLDSRLVFIVFRLLYLLAWAVAR